jgi:hypothetical protein
MDTIKPPRAIDVMEILECQQDLIKALDMAFVAIQADDLEVVPMRTLLAVILQKSQKATEWAGSAYAAEKEAERVTNLAALIANHAAVYRAWADCDNESEADQKRLAGELNTANKHLLNHRPGSLHEVKRKAEYMASNECFIDWSSGSATPVLKSLIPEAVL